MPAWMTSLLRLLVQVPNVSSPSRIRRDLPERAMARAMANPTTPAPTTIASTSAMTLTQLEVLDYFCYHAWEARDKEIQHGRHQGRGYTPKRFSMVHADREPMGRLRSLWPCQQRHLL